MKPDIVLEISGNHGGDLDNCLSLIRCAKLLGPASIKLQRFNPDRLALKRVGNPSTARALGKSEVDVKELLELYRSTETPKAWWPEIIAELGGYPWSCSVFSPEDVDFVVSRGCHSLKVASFELRDTELIKECARTKLPLVLSVNGDANGQDIVDAIWASHGDHLAPTNSSNPRKITILHATRYHDSKLEDEISRFTFIARHCPQWVDFGISDHTKGNELGVYAATRASMIERHLKLSDVPTADSEFSLTSAEMLDYMEAIKDVSRAKTN